MEATWPTNNHYQHDIAVCNRRLQYALGDGDPAYHHSNYSLTYVFVHLNIGKQTFSSTARAIRMSRRQMTATWNVTARSVALLSAELGQENGDQWVRQDTRETFVGLDSLFGEYNNVAYSSHTSGLDNVVTVVACMAEARLAKARLAKARLAEARLATAPLDTEAGTT